ncbi:MAG: helix-turn-helix domain-containing protein [Candidatus Omnitrophica bacterium]|nr:helix-turn-helix domain-containing protein [Candidatus Omnitrophota bacterium]
MSIGEALKKAREDKKLTLEQVQRSTKIQLNILINLEADAFDKLPNPTYIKGFIKQYAQYLGLDPEPLLNEYTSLNPQLPPQEIAIKSEDEKIRAASPAKKKTNLFIIILAIIVVILVAGAGLSRLIGKITPTLIKHNTPLLKEKPKTLLVRESEVLKLTITANQDSWMHIKCDGKIVYQSILKAGSSETFQAKEQIVLWVGNAAGLELNLNGHNLGSPGRGVKRDILITHEGMILPEK